MTSLELKMSMLLRSMKIDYEQEYPFLGNKSKNGKYRKWKLDFAIPEIKLAIEMEGGVFTKGRHTRPMGFIKDIEKYNQLTEHGWRLLRYSINEFKDTTRMIEQIEICLQGGKK